ncbi:hypothetical protein GCM10020369_53380 [Cryptosporangium minutisporangium]|uniref:Cupin type-2 domain-containing protein n=1 Tax=Cryptosporangium minutisporangium TaxID=113569 RepID=A0ABP6T5T6_9ACTN
MRFSPGARTNWHTHALGQALHVVSGIALIGTRDGAVFEAHPGETVACPPGEEHWHGAAPDRFTEHLALWKATTPAGPNRSSTTNTPRPAPPAADGRGLHSGCGPPAEADRAPIRFPRRARLYL